MSKTINNECKYHTGGNGAFCFPTTFESLRGGPFRWPRFFAFNNSNGSVDLGGINAGAGVWFIGGTGTVVRIIIDAYTHNTSHNPPPDFWCPGMQES